EQQGRGPPFSLWREPNRGPANLPERLEKLSEKGFAKLSNRVCIAMNSFGLWQRELSTRPIGAALLCGPSDSRHPGLLRSCCHSALGRRRDGLAPSPSLLCRSWPILYL